MSASETFARIRSVMPDESPIDLDAHARRIASTATDARRRAIVRAAAANGELVSDLVLRLHDSLEQPRAAALASSDRTRRLQVEGSIA